MNVIPPGTRSTPPLSGWRTACPNSLSNSTSFSRAGDDNAMLSWQVGRVKITRIVEMDLPVPAQYMQGATPDELRKLSWLYPHFVTEDDATLNMSVHALLVEAPGMRLVVDTCVGNDRPREITGGEPMATPFLQHLEDAGWSRDSVDAVVCT